MEKNISKTNEERDFRKELLPLPNVDKEAVEEALDFSLHHHAGQKRKSGESYIIHPIGVALRVLKKYQDIELTIAALLHDIVEDCPKVDMKEIYERFGETVGFLVDAVTKQCTSFYDQPFIEIPDRIERLIWAGMQDVRVLLLKLADREYNLNTINHLKNTKQIRMAFETQAVYLPLRRILRYDTEQNVIDAARSFTSFLVENNLSDPGETKKVLMAESFENLDSDMFGLLYADSSSIIWKITDYETYKRICETDSLNGIVRFLSIQGNRRWFQANFQFLKGAVLEEDIKLHISSFRA